MENHLRIEQAQARRSLLLGVLRDAAIAGRHCPSNTELARVFGCQSQLISHDIHVMKRLGLITTRRNGSAREVEFPDGLAIPTDELWADIRDRVCAAFDLPLYKLVGAGRKGYTVRVRKAAAWVMRNKCKGISTLSIGRLMGGKDHSSVVHYIRSAALLRERDEQFRAITDAIMADKVPPKPRTRPVAKKPTLVQLSGPQTYWCQQCESRVPDTRIAGCASRWCSLKAIA